MVEARVRQYRAFYSYFLSYLQEIVMSDDVDQLTST
jgi:hypothetical protein